MPVGTTAVKESNMFDLARKRAEQRSTADAQKSTDAIQRRFASLGSLNSGSAIKAQQQAQEQAAAQREDTMEGIAAAEAQDKAQKADKQADRDFAAQQAATDRGFQAEQSRIGREWQAGQSDIDRAFQRRVFEFDSESKLRQLDLAFDEFLLNQDTLAFNKKLQLAQLDDDDAAEKYGLYVRPPQEPNKIRQLRANNPQRRY